MNATVVKLMFVEYSCMRMVRAQLISPLEMIDALYEA